LKTISSVLVFLLLSSGTYAADCVTTVRGKTVCSNGQSAAAVNPSKGTVTTAQKPQTGVTTAHSNNGQSAGAVTTAQTGNGTKAAYNPHTGNAAVSQTNQNGVKTTQTSHGAEAKTKNGKGVATGPNGTTCAKGVNEKGCQKE
jgi:hypothetical protein